MKNALTNAYLRKEEMDTTVQECRRMGIRFASLDLNESDWEFTIEDTNCIRIGMCAIKSFGEGSAIEIKEKRPFGNFDDFIERVEKSKCSKRAIVPGIFSGLFSCFDENRRAVYEYYCEYRKEQPVDDIKLQGGQTFNVGDPYDQIEELLLSAALISTPINDFTPIGYENLKKGVRFTIEAIIKRVKKHKDKGGSNMAFITLSTADGDLDCIMFSETYKSFKSFCKKGLHCKVTGKKDGDDSCIAVSFE